jgi:hypothetical protein
MSACPIVVQMGIGIWGLGWRPDHERQLLARQDGDTSWAENSIAQTVFPLASQSVPFWEA